MHPPHRPNEPDATLPSRANDVDDDDDVFTDTSRTLHNEAKAKERKEWLWQLLSQRSSVPATPTVLVAASFFSAPCATIPQGPTTGYHPSHQGVAAVNSQKKETGKVFQTFDLVNINGGLWYRVPIFTFWREQVEKGVMLEPDMEHNYLDFTKPMKIRSKSC